jgi:hypothetical protein
VFAALTLAANTAADTCMPGIPIQPVRNYRLFDFLFRSHHVLNANKNFTLRNSGRLLMSLALEKIREMKCRMPIENSM